MIVVFVPGVPKSRGSKRAIVNQHTGRASQVDSCKTSGEWMAVVRLAAARECDGRPPLEGPVRLSLRFVMPRPKSHYRTGRHAGELKPDAPLWHATTADLDKLERAIGDALKGVAYRDDCQIAAKSAVKVYGEAPGVWIHVRAIGEEEMR